MRFSRLHAITVVLSLGLILISVWAYAFYRYETTDIAHAADDEIPASSFGRTGDASAVLYLPYISRIELPTYVNPLKAPRMGFGSTHQLSEFPSFNDLNAGWYVNWSATRDPEVLGGIEYAQMVRLHQTVTCGSRVTGDRVACPYVKPYAYEYNDLDQSSIERIAQDNPGSVYLVGNECDRMDWENGGQDEILPEVYIHAYHKSYNWIKTADPTAKVAICGVIQPTPLRLKYLSRIWTAYENTYGTMPVDIWNTHVFTMREKRDAWGAQIPPGMDDVETGSFNGQEHLHVDVGTFGQLIHDMRQFMADRGEQGKPLIVTEYGVLYNWFDEGTVHDYMLGTFDHMVNTKDCNLSQVDDCRLVQRWVWFSLADIEWDFNPHTTLFDVNTKDMTPAGIKYRQFTLDHQDELQYSP